MKQNIVLADCDANEITTLIEGVNSLSDCKFVALSSISNWGRDSRLKNYFRLVKYFTFPWKIFINRNKYDVILGWQQFYAINVAFYSRLFHVKKCNKLVVVNFTYKKKKGLIGKIYDYYMKYACNDYIDYYHVLGESYADRISSELNIDISKVVVTCFGTPDYSNNFNDAKVPFSDYSISIGRSNRDFDFLLKIWNQPCMQKHQLIIASDSWMPTSPLPNNVIHKKDIKPEDSIKWIKCSKLNIIPIDDENICSGDTVLLNGMMLSIPTAITSPSTLSEMYIKNGVNGVCFSKKDVFTSAKLLAKLLDDSSELQRLGMMARKYYVEKYTRFQMGVELWTQIQ